MILDLLKLFHMTKAPVRRRALTPKRVLTLCITEGFFRLPAKDATSGAEACLNQCGNCSLHKSRASCHSLGELADVQRLQWVNQTPLRAGFVELVPGSAWPWSTSPNLEHGLDFGAAGGALAPQP